MNERCTVRSRVIAAGVAWLACTASPAQLWKDEQSRATAELAKMVAKDTVFTQLDWSALSADVANKELVLIGEPDHGSKEVFELRNSLIAELQRKHGFTVVLFESGIGELIQPYEHRTSWSAEELANGLMGPWNNRSFAALMHTLQDANMAFAGFDVQRSGRSFAQVLHEVCTELRMDSALHVSLEDRYTSVSKSLKPKADHAIVRPEAEALIAAYDALFARMQSSTRERPSEKVLLAQRTVQNRIDFLRYMLKFMTDKDWNARWAARDSAMANNVVWLKETLYPGRKLIVIGHNYHVSRTSEKERSMGEWLHARYGDRMLVIGTFTGSGSYADNARQTKTLATPDSAALDIKHVIQGLPGFAHYLSLPDEADARTAWAYAPVVVNDTFIDLSNSNTLVPAQHFDALLLLERVSPPMFLDP